MRKSALYVGLYWVTPLSYSSGVTFRAIMFSTSEMSFSNFWLCCCLELFRLKANPIVISLMHPFNASHRIQGSFIDGLLIAINSSKCSFIYFRKISFYRSVVLKCRRAAHFGVERMVMCRNKHVVNTLEKLMSQRETGKFSHWGA